MINVFPIESIQLITFIIYIFEPIAFWDWRIFRSRNKIDCIQHFVFESLTFSSSPCRNYYSKKIFCKFSPFLQEKGFEYKHLLSSEYTLSAPYSKAANRNGRLEARTMGPRINTSLVSIIYTSWLTLRTLKRSYFETWWWAYLLYSKNETATLDATATAPAANLIILYCTDLYR